jgi:hypothetical protein
VSYTPPQPPTPTGKIVYAPTARGDNDPGPVEPICIVKIVGLFFGVFLVIVIGIWFVGVLCEHEKRATEVSLSGHEVMFMDQNGTFMGYKMTYEGHDYLKVSNSGGIVHSESCPCKNVEEEEKP